jgi:prepilin-type N-terminal cleavage/methylation domain-containing protein
MGAPRDPGQTPSMTIRHHSNRTDLGPPSRIRALADTWNRPAGFTLLEAAVALVLVSLLLGWGVPRLRSGLDRWAVTGARESLVSALARARAAALDRGSSWLQVDPVAGGVVWGSGSDSLGASDLSAEWGVRLLEGPGVGLPIRFDDLGRGQLASRTFTLVRGGATGGLSLSSYGRVRRW